jgi:CRP/FNR family cyclic AMP-dependent transcriptional regulator
MLCILIFPIIYLIGFASLALLPIFAIIVSFRFIQMLWLSGIADPAYQAMFNVIPQERRDQVRAFIDGVPQQAGTFLAGAILIIGEQTLSPAQLYLVGLAAAALCTFAIHRARRGYNEALVEALRDGNPHLFFSEEQPFGGFAQDAAAVRTALGGLKNPDAAIRRISAEILGHIPLPEVERALMEGIDDPDAMVRAGSLRALTQMQSRAAFEKIASALHDPEPDVRYEAAATLGAAHAPHPQLVQLLHPLLDDVDSRVSTRAASVLLRSKSRPDRSDADQQVIDEARAFLRRTAAFGELSDREHAIIAMGEWGDADAFAFLANELLERNLPVRIRRVLLTSLSRIDPARSIPYLVAALGNADASIRETAAQLLGQVGQPALQPVLDALQTPAQEEGALAALEQLPPPPPAPIEEYARAAVSRAIAYDEMMQAVRSQHKGEAVGLLVESLQKKASEYGVRALRAVGLLGDRNAMKLAIEILQMKQTALRANVIEALESLNTRWREIIQPLTRLWEENPLPSPGPVDWQRLTSDDDPWIRECALFAAQHRGELTMENLATLSLMERILIFKRVPLFVNLSPGDLKQVAAIAHEETFPDGTVLTQEGDVGDVMFIIVSGEVSVTSIKNQKQLELARRKAGEYVGEMALISREPRTATLTAVGNVHALCIDQKSFEALLRDRPDVSLAVIQVLCKRLKEASERLHGATATL